LESGAVILSHANTVWGHDETHIGHGGGIATLNIAGGSFSASRNFRLGNDRGTGTINITGGSLTVAGTEDVFIGRDKGTGVVNQSGGVVEFNHNTFIANGNNQSDPTSGTYNLSAGALNVKREFVIGREGVSATGTLNVTGGTITKTGNEKFLVGHDNGVGTVVQSGGTISANNELYIGNVNSGARGTYTLSGTGALNVANEVVVGRESGTGTLNVNGGTITTSGNGNMYVGRRNGTGTLNQTDGTIVVNREFGVGTRDNDKIGTGTYNLSGGSLSAVNDIFIGKEQGSSGTMIMTDGTISTSSTFRIGHNQSTGVLTQSGGTVNVQNEVNIGNESGTGTFNLNGGTVNATKISGGNGSATVNFNGGVIKAKRDESNLIENLDVANVQSGGIKINSNGFNVATSQALTGTGGLEKLGTGNLILSGNNTYTGNTTVSGGTLSIGNNSSSTFAGSSTITINSGAQLNLPNAATNIVGTLILGPQTYTSGTFNSSNSGGLITGSGTIQVGAALEPSYSDWASENAPTGTSADDYDGDGVSNGLEYVLGGDKNTNDYGKMPKVTVTGGNMIFTFERSQASINAKTDVDILVGTDLVAWPSVYTVGADTAGSTSGVTITKDSPVAGKDTVSLDVTMSSDPKKFARLRVITK
jgi:autotransporter-associated beta strand protein/T5SS/PEP-CTERM-associated repeat protein